ncbi:hypothetical protein Tco_1071200 [Tanacetum coccineum]|uniref:Uncharacterized protein n=1 Tax=Tanacetum coccineum TaxID=301880 RepID=A0ABQ5HQQ8_9ASTR
MDAKDTEYFDQLPQLHNAYRITGFSCEQTVPWERTLDNPISLTFGKFISLQEIPNADFLEHYFNFAVYNELPAKVKVKNPVLTAGEYSSGDTIPSDNPHAEDCGSHTAFFSQAIVATVANFPQRPWAGDSWG